MIWPKNDAKQEKEKKKELFRWIRLLFSLEKNVTTMRIFHFIREDTVPVEISRLLTNKQIEILPHVRIGANKIFRFVDFHLGVSPRNWHYLVIWPKNDAKQEKEKKKELFRWIRLLFSLEKNVINMRTFHFIREDPVPVEIPRLL